MPVPLHDDRLGQPAATLFGRDAEIERLRSFLATAETDGGALFLTGEPGVGKTGLLDAVSEAASDHDTRVIRAAGIQFEAGVNFSCLNQLFLPLLDDLPQLTAVHREALTVALGLGDGPPPGSLVVSNAALVLLCAVASARPLLVIVDDLHWLDRASAGVLGFVARRLHGSRVGLIGAARTGEEDFFDHAGLPALMVEPLDDRASRQLLETRFPDLGPTVVERILAEAQGNPLALSELPVALGPRMRASAKALPSTLPLGRRLHSLFGSRIGDLPPRTRQLLLRMALDGTGDVRILEAGAGSDADLRDLAPAEEARLAHLGETTHRLAFQHPLVRATVVELAHAEERLAAHRVLADAWSDQPERRAWHLGEATVEPDEVVAAQLEATAARLLARGDAVGCVKALTRASELSPRTADRGRRLAAAAYIGADVAGDLSSAAEVLAELRRGEIEVEGSMQAAIAASAFLLQGGGDVMTAHRLLVGVLDSREGVLDARDPVVADALYSLMMVCTYAGSEEMWKPFEAALARSDGIPVALHLSSKTFADPARSGGVLDSLEAAVQPLADEADPTQIIRIGIAATYVDRLEGCRAALWRVVHDARRGGAVASGITARILLARDSLETGHWDDAEQLAEEAIQVCETHGYQSQIWPSRYLQAVIAAGRGEGERAEALTDELLQWTAPRGMRVGQGFACRIRGLAALGRGDFETAYQLTSRISPPGLIAPHSPRALYVLMDLVEAAVRTGRNADATAHVAAMRKENLAGLSSRLALVVGGSAAMAASDDVSLKLFQEALALPGIGPWQFYLARVRLAYGERLRRARRTTEARVQLSEALAIFERLGARPWIGRATAELRATGQTKPRAGKDVLDRLTPQEIEIATLAARGLTNKQIAERMFLSHRTVGGHLHRAFPKLGIATRAALRDALDNLPPERLPRS